MATRNNGTPEEPARWSQFQRAIETLILEAGSHNAFHKKTGIPRSTVTGWRKGKGLGTEGPGAAALLAIAAACKTTVDWLLLGDAGAARSPAAREVAEGGLAAALGERVQLAIMETVPDDAMMRALAPSAEAIGKAVLDAALTLASEEAHAIWEAHAQATALRLVIEAIPPFTITESAHDSAVLSAVEVARLRIRLQDVLSRTLAVALKVWTPNRDGLPDAAVLIRHTAFPDAHLSHRARIAKEL